MTRVRRITRRRALKATAGAVGAALPLVHVQTASAAGKLTMGIWDHWVPAANPVLKGLVDEWGAKNKVEVAIDFIPSTGNKMVITQAAEGQARSGHDILAFDELFCHGYCHLRRYDKSRSECGTYFARESAASDSRRTCRGRVFPIQDLRKGSSSRLESMLLYRPFVII